jgi:hypothetical protein
MGGHSGARLRSDELSKDGWSFIASISDSILGMRVPPVSPFRRADSLIPIALIED